MNIRIGCSGWYYPHWAGKFYPSDLNKSEWFRYYAQKFDTVEINSTFYSFPNAARVRSWVKGSPENFVFSVKVNRTITHVKRLKDCDEEIGLFYEIIGSLGKMLGCVLFQFPPSFKYSHDNLIMIEKALDQRFCNVVEFRNISWFSEDARCDLEKSDLHVVAVSSERIPLWIKEDSVVYVRLHGNVNGYATDYNEEYLTDLAQRIIDVKPQSLYVYFNNDYSGYAPKNAIMLKSIINNLIL
ncbi:conserved hypothetical protein [Thermoplasma acidophilum]|uniref:DUF72 domain-containing protein n=1 Tax=Thermoplasma acidophilum (strain ATCC 25905 / DSM 1728 / JCM 9062 / NBRC 15155 / AMRC-C165) TaxID=273075 RepID=Q9HJH8_THEAC|nr:DUF72 domain-containing protein [Thermoplasma acidophilum]CAC12119.1 conserved hypothetical protein [Thermoplasma acidophilum]